MSHVETREGGLKSKSGLSPEELFDILISFDTISVKTDPVSLSRKKARGLAKNILRIGGVSDEGVSKVLPTSQARRINTEIGSLPGAAQAEFMQRLCELERERVFDAIRAVVRELDDDNLVAVQTLGSIDANDRWANDVDVNLVMKNIDRDLARSFRSSVQEKIVKKVDVKHMYRADEFDVDTADKLVEI